MSSNYPVIPSGPDLPIVKGDLWSWAQQLTWSIDKLYKRIVKYLNEALGGIGAQLVVTSHILSASYTIPPSAAAYVPSWLEITSGVTLEIGSGGTLEIG